MSLQYCTVCGSAAEILASVCPGCGADLAMRRRKFAQERWSNKQPSSVESKPSARPRTKTMLGVPVDPSFQVPQALIPSKPPESTESTPPSRPSVKRERKATMLGVPSFAEASEGTPFVTHADNPPISAPPPVSPAPERSKRSPKGTMFGMAPLQPSDLPPLSSPPSPAFRAIPDTDEPAAPLALRAPDPLPRPRYRARVNVHYEEGYSAPVRPPPWYRTLRGKLSIVGAIALLIVALVELFG